jgi:hypothetical protein
MDMYPDIIEAIQETVYSDNLCVFIVDTHDCGRFYPDVCVSFHQDKRLPYILWYFIELKLPTFNILPLEKSSQMLDYFYKVHKKQSHR